MNFQGAAQVAVGDLFAVSVFRHRDEDQVTFWRTTLSSVMTCSARKFLYSSIVS